MLKLCFRDIPQVSVSDMELQRGGVSYTVDTLRQIHDEEPDAELLLILGSDSFVAFQNWHQWETILKLATLAVFCRGNKNEQTELEAKKAELEAFGANVLFVEHPIMRISSTDIQRLLIFRCADEFLHPMVAGYIQWHGLYGTNRNLRCLPMEKLEEVVISLLKPERVKHVLGCRDTAVALAKCWGADETDAARAGLLHDITKALDGALQLTLCDAYGIVLDDFSRKNTKTLHALTGSLVASRIFGENDAVVSAIESHTTGKANMCLLEKIIYVADYMEPNRDFPGVDALRRLAFSDIDGALKMGLEMTLQVLRQEGRELSPGSLEALYWLSQK
jgi:nicotinate-nucleotide adenylyltransferase